jgi:hypothetical protein
MRILKEGQERIESQAAAIKRQVEGTGADMRPTFENRSACKKGTDLIPELVEKGEWSLKPIVDITQEAKLDTKFDQICKFTRNIP